MIYDSIEIIECPKCKTQYKQKTLLSSNTFGYTLWTDGRFISPHDPNLPSLMKCKNCKTLIDIDELEPVKTIDINETHLYPTIKSVPKETPSLILKALKSNFSSENISTLSLRFKYWYYCNDKRRSNSFLLDTDNKALVENLKSLLPLLDLKNENNRLSAIEIHRELGEFELALDLLNYKFSEELVKVSELMKHLCEENSKAIVEISL